MATSTTLTAAQAELISSLSRDDIPIKLRCAVCSRLAVNAFRLPCCDQAICETCQSTIKPTCPVCEHNPVSAGDCKPHKSLRTTIRVFLRTAEKKREALRAKDTPKETPPATPSTPTITPAITAPELNNAPTVDATGETKTETVAPSEEPAAETSGSTENTTELPTVNQVKESPNEDQQDIPHQSIEEIAPGQERSADAVDADEPRKDGDGKDGKDGKDAMMAAQMSVGAMGQMPAFGAGFGFDAMGGGFPVMGLNGQPDLNQMQQMQMMMMQNGMGSGFGGFPMMGAPGMMDPMTMQNMMMQNMNGGGFGMGANGMSGMNMGMGGMGAGFDSGMNNGFNGWNNQQSWNGGQDNNFNQGNASGMGAADFSANSGYHQNAAGYNQGNYGRNQQNDFQRGFSRTRGRGGRQHGFQGRGGYGSNNESFSQQFPQHGQKAVSLTPSGPVLEGVAIPTGPKADTVASAPAANVDEFGREVREVIESKEPEEPTAKADTMVVNARTDGGAAQVVEETPQNQEKNAMAEKTNGQPLEDTPMPILTLEEIEKSQQLLPNGPYTSMHPQSPMGPPISRGRRGSFNSHHRGHGGPTSWQHNVGPIQAPVVPDVPLNAPTGPKAMREGLPNTSTRGRGFSIAGRGGVRATSIPQVTPIEPSGSYTLRNDKDRSRSRSHSKSRSPSRSRSNEKRSDRHRSRRHRHRSASLTEETDEERKRRRERRRKYDEKYGSDGKDDEKSSRDDRNFAEDKYSKDMERVEKSRSASPDSRRSSHRSRRDREKERDHKSSSSRHHSSREHRSHRDRSRDRGRSKDRERSRDREHRHRREKEKHHDERHHDDKYQDDKYQEDRNGDEPASAVESILEKETNDRMPETPTSQTSGLEIKGSHRRSLREVEEKERNSHDQLSNHQHHTEDEIKIPSGPRGMREQEEKRANRSGGFDSSSNHSHRISSSSQRDKDHTSNDRRDRERDRDRNRDRDSKSSISKISAPKGPRALEIQASSHMRVDPHTAEREARNRERLMKEAQRMAGLSSMMSGGGGRKRSRDDIGDSTRGRKNRRRGGFGGDGVDEGDEERLARLESEREAR